jgi:hypothetical protein
MNKKNIERTFAKSEEAACSCLFTYNDFRDISGCLKPHAHNDAHVCENDKGEYIEWEDDYSCKCGCWDDYEAGDSRVCIVYSVVGYSKNK